MLGKEEILRQVFIHGTHLELLQPLVMDVDSMEEILTDVMGKASNNFIASYLLLLKMGI